MNPYDVLGVPRNATQDDIKKAYKALARKYHPDLNKSSDAERRFKEVSSAHDAIGDPDKRKLYDQFGDAALKPGFDPSKFHGFPGGSPFGGGGGPGRRYSAGGIEFDFGGAGFDMDDILGSMFGSDVRSRRRQSARGRDQSASVTVPPMTSFLGGEVSVTVQRPTGATESISARVPAGVEDGGKLRLKGKGLPPPGGGPCGDLLLTVHVPPHPLLERRGDDLYLDLPLTILEAIRGGAITVPTPMGQVKVSVPPGAETGAKLRLRGRGIQRRGQPGDLYLVLRPTVPKTDDPALLAAAEALEAAYSAPVRSGLDL